MRRIKYPKTFHVPWSPGIKNDDKVQHNLSTLLAGEIVITEKMDGECTTGYPDGYAHARSCENARHEARSWFRQFWAHRYTSLPADLIVNGENLYAQHTVVYNDLLSYFYGFAVWQDYDVCLSYDETLQWFDRLNIRPAPVLFRGHMSLSDLKNFTYAKPVTEGEGYVIRRTCAFSRSDFSTHVAKWRYNLVDEDAEHWLRRPVIKNGLRSI
jgi:hypothetical protein